MLQRKSRQETLGRCIERADFGQIVYIVSRNWVRAYFRFYELAALAIRCGMIGADVPPDWGPHVNKRHV
jgi:hypothetical protein